MPFALDLIYAVILAMVSPWLLWQAFKAKKYREGYGEKLLGRAPRRVGEGSCVWFHAVSVGEVLLLRPVIAELQRRRPDWDIFVSTTTSTGLDVARRTFPDLVTFYAPLDFSWAVKEAVGRIRPTILALVELELWPNLIRAAKRGGAKVAIVNGRLSPRSHRRYRWVRRLLAPTLHRIDAVAAQTPAYAARFTDLGMPVSRVSATGSVKYDNLQGDRGNLKTRALRADLGIAPSEIVFVAGSTMEGEEGAALQAYRQALEIHPHLRLILVPRHSHRFDAVADWLECQGLPLIRRSRTTQSHPQPRPRSSAPSSSRMGGPMTPIILIDTIGELGAVWGLADVAFVGGSLFPGRGGQNMMEPAAYGASVMFGPYTENFRADVESLVALDSVRVVPSPQALGPALIQDLDDPESAAQRGERARAFVRAQQGAAERAIAILERLDDSPQAPRLACAAPTFG